MATGLALAGSAPAVALPAAVGATTQISTASPVPDSCNPNAATAGVRDYEHQVSLAVSPAEPSSLAAVWTQDWDDATVLAVSRDGGKTFAEQVVAGQSPGCYGASLTNPRSATNPRAAIAADGSVYVISTVDSGTRVNVTHDGIHWLHDDAGCDAADAPCALAGGNGAPWIATDPRAANTAYALAGAYGGDSSADLVTRTTDGGATWSQPAPAAPASSGTANILGQLFVLGDGSVVDVFAQCDNNLSCRGGDGVVKAVRSTDGARTWSPVPVGGLALPVDGGFDAAVDKSGTILVASAVPSGIGWAIQINRSRDYGRTWSAATTAVETTLRPTQVTLGVAGDGTLGVTYLEHGAPGLDGVAPYEVWLASAGAGGAWQRTRLAAPTDFASMPVANAHAGDLEAMAIGEWQGLVGLPHGFAAAFPLGAPQATIGPTDVFFTRR